MEQYKPFCLESLGELCRLVRTHRGYTQQDVAEAVGTSNQNISSFERGLNNNAIILLWYVRHGLVEELKYWKVEMYGEL